MDNEPKPEIDLVKLREVQSKHQQAYIADVVSCALQPRSATDRLWDGDGALVGEASALTALRAAAEILELDLEELLERIPANCVAVDTFGARERPERTADGVYDRWGRSSDLVSPEKVMAAVRKLLSGSGTPKAKATKKAPHRGPARAGKAGKAPKKSTRRPKAKKTAKAPVPKTKKTAAKKAPAKSGTREQEPLALVPMEESLDDAPAEIGSGWLDVFLKSRPKGSVFQTKDALTHAGGLTRNTVIRHMKDSTALESVGRGRAAHWKVAQ